MKFQVKAELGESIVHLDRYAQNAANLLGVPVTAIVNDARFIFHPGEDHKVRDPALEERVAKLEERLAGLIEHHGLYDGS